MADTTYSAPQAVSAETRYNSLTSVRNPFLRRAEDCAELTLPMLLPRQGTTGASEIPTPWQSVGSTGVNNLGSKLLMAVLPPNTPMFRLEMDEIALAKYQVDDGMKTRLEMGLSKMERAVMKDVEMSGDRAGVFEMLLHLLVTGNILIHVSDMGFRVYRLDHFVCRRDPSGNPLEIIAHEAIDPVVLPAEIREYVKRDVKYHEATSVDLYTRITRTDTKWVVTQEVCGQTVPGVGGAYPLDKCPWLPLRFIRVDGQDYGRGYVETVLGDLRSLEDLSQALAEGARAAAKLLFMCNPNGTTKPEDLAKAANGDFVNGIKDEVTALQVEKYHDFRVAFEQAQVISNRLSYAFLLHTAVQRDAERVTAEEIRYMAQELETTLGGFYTLISQEFQLPYIRLKMTRMQRQNKLPQLPKGLVKPTIITGIEAIGRGNDRNKLVQYGQTLTAVYGPEAVARRLNFQEFSDRLATSDGIDTKNLVVSDEQIAEQDKQAQMQSMIEKLGPHVINTGGKLATQSQGQATK